jgi:hypothetical protein
MGLGVNDLNQDGYLDYCMSDVGPKLVCLLSTPEGPYYEAGQALGLTPNLALHPDAPAIDPNGEPLGSLWSSWGVAMVDLDNDRNLDVATVAGPPPDGGSVALSDLLGTFQADWIWMGTSEGTFEAIPPTETTFNSTNSHYGLLSADLDNDGFRELIVGTPFSGSPKIFDNPCREGNWLEVLLVGPGKNRGAYGSQVLVERDDQHDLQEVHSLLGVGQSPSTLHFGLGDLTEVPRLTVRWSDGTKTVIEAFEPNRKVTIFHPDSL